MKAKIEIWKATDGDWWWRLRASNGKIMANSAEGYRRKDTCERMVGRMKMYFQDAKIVERT